MNSFHNRLIESGLPIHIPSCHIRKQDRKKVSDFLDGKMNLVILGEKHYYYSLKIMRLKLAKCVSCTMYNFSANYLLSYINTPAKFIFDKFNNYPTVAITMINDVSYRYKILLSSIVDFLLADNRRLLLSSALNSDGFSDVFSYNWDSMDNNFEVISLES